MSTTPTPDIVPVIAPKDLLFFYSGGYYNADPKQSLGGAQSNFRVISGTLNGLFDRVDTNEASQGDIEYRCIYLKNVNQTRKLLKAKIWIETTTSSPTTSVSVSIGSAGINEVEPAIPHESVQPPMQFFAVPLSAPDIPNIGDLYPGDSIGLWVRWTVNANTLSNTDDYCVLRLDGEREPESLTSPLPDDDEEPPPPSTTCPNGYHWDYVLLQCVPTTEPIVCPTGYTFDTVEQRCKPNDPGNPPPITGCPSGYHWDVVSMRCVPTDTPIVCPTGYVYDEASQRCKPISTPPPTIQNTTFGIISDCVTGSVSDDVMETVASHINITDINQSSFVIHGGDATHSDGDVQPFFDKCEANFGVLNPNHIFPVLGNHDDSEDGTAQDGQDVINNFPAMAPTGYYAVTRRNIRIICMNTQIDYDVGSPQHTFVMAQLVAASNDPAIKWKILVFHKPIVCTSGHHAVLTDLRDWLMPACDLHHVDLTISGHNHIYCRTLPLKYNSATPATPTIVSTQANGNYINVDGRIFLVTGTGGRDTNILFNNSTAESFVAYRRMPPPYGGINVTLQDNGNQLAFEARDIGDTIMDSWTLSKPSSGDPPVIVTCPSGYHWDEIEGRCIPSPTTCPTGQHWDTTQNRCVQDVVNPPPDTSGSYPVSNIEWYYDSASIMATDAVIASDDHASDGVLLSSGASSVDSCEISEGWLYIQTGGGNGRVYWDYHTLPRFDQDDQPGFNIAMTFKFRHVGNDNVSVKDGNHGTGGFEFENSLVFGGFGFSIHPEAAEVQSKVEYWHNEQGDETSAAFPGNRTMEVNGEYRVFFTLRTDRVAERVVLNVWIDFGDGSNWVHCMTDRVWQNSGWSPGSIPDGDDAADIESGPSHIKRFHVWIRNNAGGDPLPVTDVKIGTVPFIS